MNITKKGTLRSRSVPFFISGAGSDFSADQGQGFLVPASGGVDDDDDDDDDRLQGVAVDVEVVVGFGYSELTLFNN